MGSTITSFRKKFNNHKSPMRKYEQGGRKMSAEHLYAHFFGPGHKGLDDVRVIIIIYALMGYNYYICTKLH